VGRDAKNLREETEVLVSLSRMVTTKSALILVAADSYRHFTWWERQSMTRARLGADAR
jgi:hypothetical protein